MDKRTVIAVVLAVVVIIGSMIVQQRFFAPEQPTTVAEPADGGPQPVVEEQPAEAQTAEGAEQPPVAEQPSVPGTATGEMALVTDQQIEEQTFTLETEVFRVGFTNRGGQITSIELKDFSNTDGSPVEMIFSQDSGINPFSFRFGGVDTPPVDALFQVERSLIGAGVTFSRTFRSQTGVPFTLKKSYLLQPRDYMIELRVSIENSINEYPALNYNGYAYTLGFGPQIGPEFEKLDRRNEFREYLYYADEKRENVRMKQESKQIDRRVTWAAIAGKYFAVIAVPDTTQYLITYDTRPIEGLNEQSSLYFSRPEIKSARSTDLFRFYVGPKKQDVLKSYNDAEKNAYKLSNMHFEETSTRRFFLTNWLAEVLKFFLELFYRLIPNYGVAIILVTVLLKVLLFPLTRKSYESTARMQTLQPKINELREKYKNNPQKLNQEMAQMYKKEGVSPLGGCLPMLLQFPILIAFYSLLNTHFALRGAVFIPGWINDLSAPESVISFTPIQILSFEFGAIRALPFIMLVTTFLSSKLMQSPSTDASGRNMKMMTYMMPIMFFFILYNMPSGLLLYWTMQNIFTVAQQWYINYRRQKKNAGGGADLGPLKRKK
ncbi:MAG: membrane protein insertase YidC [Spirochaetaceae bacterium]|nr:MAG: membrane protein insertase YidC [Spirochaetaceae bacterium]